MADDRQPRGGWRLTRDISIALAVALAAPGLIVLQTGRAGAFPRLDAEARAIHAALQAGAPEGLESAYRHRQDKPLWSDGRLPSPAALDALAMLERARDDGLDPAIYRLEEEAPRAGSAFTSAGAARFDLALSSAVARYITDLHSPPSEAELFVTDPAVAPWRPTPAAVAERLAAADDVGTELALLRRMNPLYERHRAALARLDPGVSPAVRRQLALTLERLRALPVDLGARYVLVNVAQAQLTATDADGGVQMRVAVGKPRSPTPSMAGLVRYAVFNPYWNVPPDIVRDRFAVQVLRTGATGPGDDYDVLDPAGRPYAAPDWRAVRDGSLPLRLRQRPGPGNMMGAVKFMFPNSLGIYLHDTPDKAVFRRANRQVSAGCVRLERADLLRDWLFGQAVAGAVADEPEQAISLPSPVPVYILYLTATVDDHGRVSLLDDTYGRDARLEAQMRRRPAGLSA